MNTLGTTEVVVMVLVGAAILMVVGVLVGRRTRHSSRQTTVVIKRTRQVGSFEARNGNGREMRLALYQEYLDAGTRDDPHAERKGRLQIMTADGRHVDKIGTRKYRVMGSSDVLTSEDPNAP